MISDAGGSEVMIKCATRYPCSVCKRMSRPRLRRPVSVPRTRQFNDTLLADVHCWNYQSREVLVFSLIDESIRFHVTQVLPLQSARDLYEAIMGAWVKWAGAPRFLLVDPHRSLLARPGNTRHHRFRGSCRSIMDPWSCGTSWRICAIHGSQWSA